MTCTMGSAKGRDLCYKDLDPWTQSGNIHPTLSPERMKHFVMFEHMAIGFTTVPKTAA